MIQCSSHVCVENPFVSGFPIKSNPTLHNGIVASTTWTKSIAVWFKTSLPTRFECILHNRLRYSVLDSQNTEWSLLATSFGYVDTFSGSGYPSFDIEHLPN